MRKCVDAMDGQLSDLAKAADDTERFRHLIGHDMWTETRDSTAELWKQYIEALKLSSWESIPF